MTDNRASRDSGKDLVKSLNSLVFAARRVIDATSPAQKSNDANQNDIDYKFYFHARNS